MLRTQRRSSDGLRGHRALHCILLAVLPAIAAMAEESASPIISTLNSSIRVETTPVRGGGELYTFFKRVADPRAGYETHLELPVVSILRDTLGDSDPENDQLRDVWDFTYARPSPLRRAAAAIPFWYSRASWAKPWSSTPRPLLDLAKPADGTWTRVLARVLQSTVLDPLGMPFRATSRAYRSRAGEYRAMHVWRTVELLSAEPDSVTGIAPSELDFIRGRLVLSHNVLGGLVEDRYVVPAWKRFETSATETRGQNWELLRQRAEANGLYFQPLMAAGNRPSFAVLWIEQAAVGTRTAKFDSKFLGIPNPFRDDRIRHWKGYSEEWQLDAYGSRIRDDAQAVQRARMVPLALYSLNHPRVPLKLVNFRNPRKPRRDEMIRRATDDVATGVLGWTGMGNLTWLAAKTSWSLIWGRWGVPVDRNQRVRAYVQVRQSLAADSSLNPEFRRDIARRLDLLGLNPFDNASRAEQDVARKQHAVLLERARRGGLIAHLNKQRTQEANALLHSRRQRVLWRVARIASLGIWRHQQLDTPELLEAVDRSRRINWHRRYLEQVLASGPTPDVVADMEEVRRSIAVLARLSALAPRTRGRSVEVVSAILARSADEQTRAACLESLAQLNTGQEATKVSAAAIAEQVKSSGGGGQ